MYGHRYWREVRDTILEFARGPHVPGSLDLAAQVQEIARDAAARAGVDPTLTVGIAAVGVRTLQQVGMPLLEVAPAAVAPDPRTAALTPDQVVARRAKDDSQGVFGFLKGERKVWTITYDEQRADATFPLVHSQHVTTAAGLDTRDHRARDGRLSEGPIPVHCRSASCGTCWVGVLGGAEKLSAMDD